MNREYRYRRFQNDPAKEERFMSLLSKLLGGKKPTLSDVVDLLQGKDAQAEKPSRPAPAPAQNTWAAPSAQTDPVPEGPSGVSWGERMPNEPNQYNYPGTYREYFEDIFYTEFSAFRVVRSENPYTSRASSYSFFTGDSPVLVVELLSSKSEVFQIRKACHKNGIPYLRFYYDYEGWWNARSYVVRRMREAIGA